VKLKRNQDPQRLSGLNGYKIPCAIVRPISKDLEKGITRPSAIEIWSVAQKGESNRFWRETEDELCRDMLAGTASVVNCVNGTNGDNPTEITAADVDAVVQTLQSNDADFITSMKEGDDKFGTGPIMDAYFGMAHTDMIGQLRNVAGFIEKAQYPNQQGVGSAEWGSVGNIRFMVSSRGSITTNASLLGADIYNVFVTGREAYGVIDQTSQSAAFIFHPPGHGEVIAVDKSLVIDLDTYGESYGDKAQAEAEMLLAA